MPPVRNIRMPSSTVISGKVALIASGRSGCRPDTGGSWARRRRSSSPARCPRSTVNSFVRKPSAQPRSSSSSTTRLKPESLSGEKATTSSLTGANRAKHRHAQQNALTSLEKSPADHVGRHRPHQDHARRRRHDAEPGDLTTEQTLDHRRRPAVHEPEDPDERRDADEERHRHEEAGDEAAAKPLHSQSPVTSRQSGPRAHRQPAATAATARAPEHDAIPGERARSPSG